MWEEPEDTQLGKDERLTAGKQNTLFEKIPKTHTHSLTVIDESGVEWEI